MVIPKIQGKFMVFYLVTILAVLIIFKLVNIYGNSKIKAPLRITGSYTLEAVNLPDCLNNNQLTLNIEQSGIYLFGNLSLSNMKYSLPINGEFRDNKINITSHLKNIPACNSINPNILLIVGELMANSTNTKTTLSPNNLQGNLHWGRPENQTSFIGIFQEPSMLKKLDH